MIMQRLFKHFSSTHPYPMKYIVVLLCAAKQNALFWRYVAVLTLVLLNQNAESKKKSTVAPNWLLHLWFASGMGP